MNFYWICSWIFCKIIRNRCFWGLIIQSHSKVADNDVFSTSIKITVVFSVVSSFVFKYLIWLLGNYNDVKFHLWFANSLHNNNQRMVLNCGSYLFVDFTLSLIACFNWMEKFSLISKCSIIASLFNNHVINIFSLW